MSTFFKRGAVALLALAVLVLPVLLTACNKIKLADYPAIPTSFAYETDGNATVAQAGTDFEMPFNPSRGMRGETYLTLGSGGEAFPSSGDDAMRRLDAQLESFADEGITLMQVYIYLTNYCNDPLPESALEELKTYMTAVRERGVKMLLRFAYEYSESNKEGPRTRDIIGHCEQLKSFFEQNAELFDDTVYAVQLGMIGLWGEGHSSVHSLNERKIIKAVADMVPDDVFVMVRTPELLTKVPEEEEARFGVHDDYLVGCDDEWGMMDWSDPEYAKLLRKCKFALTDGEMPWGDQSPDGIDMLGVVGQAVGYGLTSLSIEHNYIEGGAEYLLKRWQSEYLTPGQLDELGYPYNPYLVGERISVFDYLRHHLGYQLAASDLRIEGGRASFMLTNYGFAAAHGFKIEIYAGGRLVAADGDPDLGTLTAFGQRVFSFDYDGGDIEVKIFSVRDPDAVVRLYNEVPFESGRNVICRT